MFKWHHQTTFLTTVGVASLAVFSVTLFVAGFMSGRHIGYQGAANKVAEVFPRFEEPVYSLSGVVQEILPEAIVIEAQRLTANPLDDGPKVRTVLVAVDTIIRKVALKSPNQLNADAALYKQQLTAAQQTGAAAPSAPMPYTQFAMELSQLQRGDLVEVHSKSDIRTATEFGASEIYQKGSAQQ